ncbi:uncharacterized protein BP5553_00007 [Venustampulla echinocandica]|uniref:Uncharacterized protein n=1 Tax=Venustampulla echinocandica TaxID=2656787 RepID=A0A370TX18_9HELO|nr:uncharacterized protein BP5553_00007 [Venustampulla echinocandica]RDL40028.1 hypothetical protein BP5553_00007 [Venustampulla echinocandica]
MADTTSAEHIDENVSPFSSEESPNMSDNGNSSASDDPLDHFHELAGTIMDQLGSIGSTISKVVEKATTLDDTLNQIISSIEETQSKILESIARVQDDSGSKCTCSNSNAILAEAIGHIVSHLEQLSLSKYARKDNTASCATPITAPRESRSIQEQSSISTKHFNRTHPPFIREEAITLRDHPEEAHENWSTTGQCSSPIVPRIREESSSKARRTQVGPAIASQNNPVDQLAHARRLIAHLIPRRGRLSLRPDDLVNGVIVNGFGPLLPRGEAMQTGPTALLRQHPSRQEQPNLAMGSPSANVFQPPPTISGQTRTVGFRRAHRTHPRPAPIYELSPDTIVPPISGPRNSSSTEINAATNAQSPVGQEQTQLHTPGGTSNTAQDRAAPIHDDNNSRPASANSIDSRRGWPFFGRRSKKRDCQIQ